MCVKVCAPETHALYFKADNILPNTRIEAHPLPLHATAQKILTASMTNILLDLCKASSSASHAYIIMKHCVHVVDQCGYLDLRFFQR